MQEYLAFVDEIGRNSQGDYIYRFDFTTNTDVVWGDYFNIVPAVIVPKMEPDSKTISSHCKVNISTKLIPACKNACFSMQDCIDGIIPLVFTEVDSEEPLSYNGEMFKIMFGETYENVEKYINQFGFQLYDKENIEEVGDTSLIDKIIEDNKDNEF